MPRVVLFSFLSAEHRNHSDMETGQEDDTKAETKKSTHGSISTSLNSNDTFPMQKSKLFRNGSSRDCSRYGVLSALDS